MPFHAITFGRPPVLCSQKKNQGVTGGGGWFFGAQAEGRLLDSGPRIAGVSPCQIQMQKLSF